MNKKSNMNDANDTNDMNTNETGNDKITKVSLKDLKRSRNRLRIFAFGASSLILLLVLVTVAYTVLAAQRKNSSAQETSQASTERDVLHVRQLDGSIFTIDEPVLEDAVETEAATEAQPEETTVAPVEIIPVAELNVAQEDLSVEEPHQEVEVAQETPASTSTYEISKLVYGIDVSKWQGDIDWAQVKADGIDFAMIKMGGRSTGSSGELYVDSKFERNIQGAIANGIQVGVYFFSQAVNETEALEEASLLIDSIKKYKITYPVAFDWESAGGYRVADAGLSKDSLTRIVSVFCDTVASYGYTPMSYFCRNDWYNSVNGSELSSKYKSWLAVYWGEYYNDENARNWYNASSGELPNFKYSFQMWQYTSRGHVAGINGCVDMDIALFTYANYKVDKTPVTLTVPATTITSNVGVSLDLMKGVSATNSIGFDATSSINLSVIDKDGDDVSSDLNWPVSHPGKYKLYYRFKDPAGESKEVVVTLTVRDVPVITVKSSNITYLYNSSISVALNKEAILKQISDNVSALSYEGKTITVTANGTSAITDPFSNGTFTVTYTADDGLGLTSTSTVNVTVNNVNSSTSGSTEASTEGSTGSSTTSTKAN